MATPKVSAESQQKIEKIIATWRGKLTWSALVKAIELEIGLKTTRQTLTTYVGIDSEYRTRKALLRGATPAIYTKVTASEVSLIEQIESLRAEVVLLERNNAEQLRMIERIFSNASEIPNIDLNDLVRKRPED
ncbi:hypothetical protein TW85_04985 [Marinomonas sp. S3726]|uniref:hypothetical protein n=1 Tax=Marinomonas sp. S3726 TaxID=579484 RepID=UPI0005FA05BD|nr:hypothetical protein [Marinomonas sp. S3726]KJZ15397.1 hypothetical protein TW85_04985 [Marinomonas sp. S3726]